MIFPESNPNIITIFRCPQCGQTYVQGSSTMSCCVAHSPGSCCHYTDQCLSQEKLTRIKEVLNES